MTTPIDLYLGSADTSCRVIVGSTSPHRAGCAAASVPEANILARDKTLSSPLLPVPSSRSPMAR
jgi:hypothetical protein